MSATITLAGIGKAYKSYPTRFSRLKEWVLPLARSNHKLNWVLRDVSFTATAGEAIGIVGINGAGKSTLLKVIAGITQPTQGAVKTVGRISALLELGIGFHPDFTGRQNAIMAGQLLGIGTDQMHRLIPELADFAEIGEFLDQPVRVYSSGMQLRLAFAVATVVRPDILIVDEALAVGDAYFQSKCYQRIRQFKDHGTTLLLVTHNPGDVLRHCERAILLANGTITCDGPAGTIINHYLEAMFERPVSRLGTSLPPHTAAPEDSRPMHGRDPFQTRPGYNSNEHRWGQGSAEIFDYLVLSENRKFPGVIRGNSSVDFIFQVRFGADWSSVVPGLLIKTLDGMFIYGTNSLVSSPSTARIPAGTGDIKIFRFVLPMALAEGAYIVSFGISSGDSTANLVPLDRRYDSVIIHVAGCREFAGLIDMNASFQVLDALPDIP